VKVRHVRWLAKAAHDRHVSHLGQQMPVSRMGAGSAPSAQCHDNHGGRAAPLRVTERLPGPAAS